MGEYGALIIFSQPLNAMHQGTTLALAMGDEVRKQSISAVTTTNTLEIELLALPMCSSYQWNAKNVINHVTKCM